MGFAKTILPGTVVGLQGELGAGKTLFAKGMIHQLSKIPLDEITSPTFTLMEEYPGNPILYHVDLYRLEHREAGEDLPWDDFYSPRAVTLIEWPERLPGLISRCQYLVKLSKQGPQNRNIEIVKVKD